MFVVDQAGSSVGLFGGLAVDGITIFFSNSSYAKVDLATGKIAKEAQLACRYESDDCSGICYSIVSPIHAPSNVVIGKQLFVASGEVKNDLIAKSAWSLTDDACLGGMDASIAKAWPTKVIPDLKYPIPAPIKIEAR